MDWEKRFGVVEARLSRIEDGFKTLFSIRHVAPSDRTSRGTVSRSNKPPVNEADSTLAMLSEEIRRLREAFHGLKEEYTSSSAVNAHASAPDGSRTQPAEADERRQTGPNDPPGIPTREISLQDPAVRQPRISPDTQGDESVSGSSSMTPGDSMASSPLSSVDGSESGSTLLPTPENATVIALRRPESLANDEPGLPLEQTPPTSEEITPVTAMRRSKSPIDGPDAAPEQRQRTSESAAVTAVRRPESLVDEGPRPPPEFPPSMTTSATEERRFSLGLEDLGENSKPLSRGKRKRQSSVKRSCREGREQVTTDDADGEEEGSGDNEKRESKRIRNQPVSSRILAAMVQDKAALEQFFSLVRLRRGPNDWLRYRRTGDPLRRIAHHLSESPAQSDFAQFIVRFEQSQLAKQMDGTKRSRLRVTPAVKKAACNILGWKQRKFEHHLSIGRKWNRVCGESDGLLCFIMLSKPGGLEVAPESYWAMADEEVAEFHRLLNNSYTRSICAAGKAFQDSLGGAEDTEFRWESINLTPAKVLEENMLSYLAPFPSISKNIYDPARHPNWPRPQAWPAEWPWPVDPTSEGAAGCELCEGTTACDCIDNGFPKVKPRIKRYEGKGLGLQAVAASPGQIAYPKNARIGHITGEIVPLHKYRESHWVLEFTRPDIDDAHTPAVCQLFCGETGNCFRLLNHDCKPSARFTSKKVSGRYIMVVEALKDIYDGTEITVSYGNGFFGEACSCQTCKLGGRKNAARAMLAES